MGENNQRYNDLSQKKADKAQRREELKQKRQQWWEDVKQSARDYADYWRNDFTNDATDYQQTSPQPKAATRDYGNIGEGVTIDGVSINGVSTNGNGVTPTGTNGNTTNGDGGTYLQQNLDAVEQGTKAKAQRWEQYNEALKKIQSPYKTMLTDFTKGRENLALRQERDARSRAIANALGSLVNVFTSGAVARRGGFAPIVTPHNNEPDSALRKSIEGRYAIENENEGLLMNLQKERIKHQEDLEKAKYDADVAAIDARTKTVTDYNTALAREQVYADRQAATFANQQALQEQAHKNDVDLVETKAQVKKDAEELAAKDKKAQEAKDAEELAAKDKKAQEANDKKTLFINAVAAGKKKKTLSGNKLTSSDKPLDGNDEKAITAVYNSLTNALNEKAQNGKIKVGDEDLDIDNAIIRIAPVYNFVWKHYQGRIGDGDLLSFIINEFLEGTSVENIQEKISDKYKK
jgi:hypothetical protein